MSKTGWEDAHGFHPQEPCRLGEIQCVETLIPGVDRATPTTQVLGIGPLAGSSAFDSIKGDQPDPVTSPRTHRIDRYRPGRRSPQ